MARPSLNETNPDILRAMKAAWIDDYDAGGGLSFKDIWIQCHGLDPRKVRDVPKETRDASLTWAQIQLAKVKKEYLASPKRKVRRSAPWKPWPRTGESPLAFAHLLKLNVASRAIFDRGIDAAEAKMATHLRVALEGLPLYGQLCFIRVYNQRQRLADVLNETLYTDDLDAMLGYQPWLPEHEKMYEEAVSLGFAPPPLVYTSFAFVGSITKKHTAPGYSPSYWNTAKEMLYQFATRGVANRIGLPPVLLSFYLSQEMNDFFGIPNDYVPSDEMEKILEGSQLAEQKANAEQEETE